MNAEFTDCLNDKWRITTSSVSGRYRYFIAVTLKTIFWNQCLIWVHNWFWKWCGFQQKIDTPGTFVFKRAMQSQWSVNRSPAYLLSVPLGGADETPIHNYAMYLTICIWGGNKLHFVLIMFTFFSLSPFLNFREINGGQTQLAAIPAHSFPYLLISDNNCFKAYSSENYDNGTLYSKLNTTR